MKGYTELNKFFYFILINILCQMAADLPINEHRLSHLMKRIGGAMGSSLLCMWIAQNSTMGKKARLVATIISSVGPSIFMWQFFNKDANKKNENGILKYILLGCYSLGNAWIVHKHDSDDQQDLATKNLFLGGALGYTLALSADYYYSYRKAAQKQAEAQQKAKEAEAEIQKEINIRNNLNFELMALGFECTTLDEEEKNINSLVKRHKTFLNAEMNFLYDLYDLVDDYKQSRIQKDVFENNLSKFKQHSKIKEIRKFIEETVTKRYSKAEETITTLLGSLDNINNEEQKKNKKKYSDKMLEKIDAIEDLKFNLNSILNNDDEMMSRKEEAFADTLKNILNNDYINEVENFITNMKKFGVNDLASDFEEISFNFELADENWEPLGKDFKELNKAEVAEKLAILEAKKNINSLGTESQYSLVPFNVGEGCKVSLEKNDDNFELPDEAEEARLKADGSFEELNKAEVQEEEVFETIKIFFANSQLEGCDDIINSLKLELKVMMAEPSLESFTEKEVLNMIMYYYLENMEYNDNLLIQNPFCLDQDKKNYSFTEDEMINVCESYASKKKKLDDLVEAHKHLCTSQIIFMV